MRYYHYGYKDINETSDKENNRECFITELDNIRKENVYNSSLVIEDDTVYEIDQDCIRCKK